MAGVSNSADNHGIENHKFNQTCLGYYCHSLYCWTISLERAIQLRNACWINTKIPIAYGLCLAIFSIYLLFRLFFDIIDISKENPLVLVVIVTFLAIMVCILLLIKSLY